MDPICSSITLYSAQARPVLEVLRRDGVCFSREAYVRKKYQDISPLFLTAYHWFVEQAAQLAAPPDGAEFPYWAFADPYSVEGSGDVEILRLEVPRDQVVLFDLYDWNRILQLQPLFASEAEERTFRKELRLRGITAKDVMLTSFYPELRQQVLGTWPRLLRHHEALLRGDCSGVGGVQAALWQIRSEWVR